MRRHDWLLWSIARFDATVRLARANGGVPARISAEKAERELGWHARPARDTIMETAHSRLELGVVRSGAGTARRDAHRPATGLRS
jgi:dihydroflavonol-4-reductase